MIRLLLVSGAISLALAACGAGAVAPTVLDTANDRCAFCRMAVSEQRFAAQIVAPGEETRFFDDLGCLRDHLDERGAPNAATVFVADHRTGAWVRAARAVLTRVDGLQTPMGSDVIAHADPGSRELDPAAADGVPVSPREWFGPGGPPDGGGS